MAVIADIAVQGAQMLLVLLLAPVLTGFVRKVKARCCAGRGRRCCSPTATWCA
jgi:formate hydrogenlyase subunit 4